MNQLDFSPTYGNVLDFLQSASNAAASNVSGPVDMISWALRKAGLPIPQDAFGGSQWMENKGLTRKVQQNPFSLAGETFGMTAPIVVAAKAPQIADSLLRMNQILEQNAAVPRALNSQAGAIVYHGSPHKFDKFDSSKIGTGEGAQAYGHGLYLADSPEVAKSYLTAGGPGEFLTVTPKNGPQIYGDAINEKGLEAIKLLEQGAQRAGQFPHNTAYYAQKMTSDPEVLKLIDAWKDAKIGYQTHQSFYKVDLPDTAIAKMLDWDKPMSQQPEAAQKVFNEWVSSIPQRASARTVGDLMNSVQAGGTGHLLADDLRKAGITGIKYLDQGSRAAGKGSYNYVVFPGEEQNLKILERNSNKLANLE